MTDRSYPISIQQFRLHHNTRHENSEHLYKNVTPVSALLSQCCKLASGSINIGISWEFWQIIFKVENQSLIVYKGCHNTNSSYTIFFKYFLIIHIYLNPCLPPLFGFIKTINGCVFDNGVIWNEIGLTWQLESNKLIKNLK